MGAVLFAPDYPVGCRLQGVWSWQELEQAVACGCTLIRVLDLWVHLAAGRPFLPWWEALQEGRRMPGLAGLLAKTTGNALWGRFCMDSHGGHRTIRGVQGKQIVQRKVQVRGGVPAAHDLAETVSGRVRARLHRLATDAGPLLVSAHTDGAWLRAGLPLPDGWRLKERARRLDLIDPQMLRYWPRPPSDREPFHVCAGVTALEAPEQFEARWQAGGYALEAAAA